MDLAVDLPPCHGYKHVLVMVDYATNYVLAIPIKSKRTDDLLLAFKNWISTFGIPHATRHDQELGLTGGDFASYCANHSITQIHTLPYKSSANGKAEVQIRNFKHALQKLCIEASSKSNWSSELWKVQIALNSSVSMATDNTPELLMFGETLLNKQVDIALVTSDNLTAHEIRKESAMHQKDQQFRQLHARNKSR